MSKAENWHIIRFINNIKRFIGFGNGESNSGKKPPDGCKLTNSSDDCQSSDE